MESQLFIPTLSFSDPGSGANISWLGFQYSSYKRACSSWLSAKRR